MSKSDWNNAFGNVPRSFENRVEKTVEQLRLKQSLQPMKRPARPHLAFVLVAVILLMLGTAVALSSLGVLDTLHENLRAFLQPKATELVQTAVRQTAEQPHCATFTAEQAINDGHQIYATVRVHADDGVLLMDTDAEGSMSVDHWKGYEYQYEGQTFSNRAYETGRLLVQADCEAMDADGGALNVSVPEIAYDGEDILYTIAYPADVEGAYLRLSTYEVYSDEKPHNERLSFGRLTLDVPVTDTRSFYSTELPVSINYQGGKLVLTELKAEQTPIATYVTYAYGAADSTDDLMALNLQDGIWPIWLDDHGEPYPEGENGKALDQSESGATRCTIIYRAFEQMPDHMNICFHGGMSRGEDALLTVKLIPVNPKEESL